MARTLRGRISRDHQLMLLTRIMSHAGGAAIRHLRPPGRRPTAWRSLPSATAGSPSLSRGRAQGTWRCQRTTATGRRAESTLRPGESQRPRDPHTRQGLRAPAWQMRHDTCRRRGLSAVSVMRPVPFAILASRGEVDSDFDRRSALPTQAGEANSPRHAFISPRCSRSMPLTSYSNQG